MPVDPNALATWANAITVGRLVVVAGHVPGDPRRQPGIVAGVRVVVPALRE